MPTQKTQNNNKIQYHTAAKQSVSQKNDDETLSGEQSQTEQILQTQPGLNIPVMGMPPGNGQGNNAPTNSQMFHYFKKQPNLTIGISNDTYEREADRTSVQIKHMSEMEKIQRMCTSCENEDRQLQRKPWEHTGITVIQKYSGEREKGIQLKPWVQKADNSAFSQNLEQRIDTSRGQGSPLRKDSKSFMENRFGLDFSNVRIHTGPYSAQLNKELNSRAFTIKNDIYFNQGSYNPHSNESKRLLAHELTHVIQQGGMSASSNVNKKIIQRASLISDGEFFLIISQGESRFYFTNLVTAVQRRYRLDRRASYQVARWLDARDDIFRGSSYLFLTGDLRIQMPRVVAFFLVDWVEPYNPYASDATATGDYRIQSSAFEKAQQMWRRENVFVGFRRGAGMTEPSRRRITFQGGNLPGGDIIRHSQSELDLLAQRPAGELPEGFFHIVVTGSTTQGNNDVFGKTIQSHPRQPVTARSQGIILFAQNYARYGFHQTEPSGSTGRELGELLAHEIGHFLFRLTHNEPPEATPQGGFIIRSKTDFMRGGGSYDPNDRLGATSRREMEEAFRTGTIPRPERTTR